MFDPRAFNPKDWTEEQLRQIEFCRCGHAREAHMDNERSLAIGHGWCYECGPDKCPKFTFKEIRY